jgi:NADPH:quinone reductase-like Zn-dependent oxidoreductase
MTTQELGTLPSERAAPRVMRAAIVDRHGPREIVQLADVPPPHPTDRDVLVRVHAAAVTFRGRSLVDDDVQLTEAAR